LTKEKTRFGELYSGNKRTANSTLLIQIKINNLSKEITKNEGYFEQIVQSIDSNIRTQNRLKYNSNRWNSIRKIRINSLKNNITRLSN